MPIEYDLVVVGASAVGLEAAQIAVRYGARVALVTQGDLETEPIAHRAFQSAVMQIAGASRVTDRPHASTWAGIQQAVKTAIDDYRNRFSPDTLEMQGIEVITGSGSFTRSPKLGFWIDDRLLRSRAFLLALPAATPDRSAEITPHLCDLLTQQPKQVAILCGQSRDIELALALHQLGVHTTLISADPILLPQADREIAFRLQAHCEALGISVLTDSPLQQTKQIDEQIWLQVGNRAIATDALFEASSSAPDWSSLNLAAFQVKPPIGQQLQPFRPGRIGRSNLYIAPYDLEQPQYHPYSVALKLVQDILLPPWQRSAIDPWNSRSKRQPSPGTQYQVQSTLSAAGIGLTADQAIHRYGRQAIVLRGDFTADGTRFPASRGFCKLISHRNGTMLGCHAIGSGAIDLVEFLGWAQQQHTKLPKLLGRIALPGSPMAQIQPLIEQWQHQRRSPFCHELLLDWFSWQRSRWR